MQGAQECNQKRTGHRSLDGLHNYKYVTPSQKLAVAHILMPKVTVTSVASIPMTTASTLVSVSTASTLITSTLVSSGVARDEYFLDKFLSAGLPGVGVA